MGSCQSIQKRYEDPDDKEIKIKNKQYAKEIKEFQRQIRLQKEFSELDINGKGVSRKK
jgi:hypothetical protein